MKKLLLFSILFTFTAAAISQSLVLSYEGTTLEPGETIQVILDPDETVVTAYISCTNNNTSSLSVKTKKIIQEGDTITGTSNYFCWGACFPPFVYVSPTSIMIDPDVTNEDFYADYEPRGHAGISRITYVFFDENNPDDSAAVTVDWNGSPAGIADELLGKVQFSDAYPNPATSVTKVDFELPEELENATVVITNLLGAKVKEFPVNGLQGQLEIPVFDMEDGIYFYTLKAQNNLAVTKKFVVRH
jgi:hypothetical protein